MFPKTNDANVETGEGERETSSFKNVNLSTEPVNLQIVEEREHCDNLSITPVKNNEFGDNEHFGCSSAQKLLKYSDNNSNCLDPEQGTPARCKPVKNLQDNFLNATATNKETSSYAKVKTGDIEQALENEQRGCSRFLGILLALFAALQFSLSALIIKLLGYHPFNLGVWRFGVMAVIPIPFLLYSSAWKKENVFEGITSSHPYRTVALVMLQAILGANSILFVFYGLKYLNIADSIVIGTSAPVFVTLFAFIFLGERCGIFPVVTALLALVGVAIISKPPILTGAEKLNEATMLGVACSFSSMILLTICYVAIRYLRKVHHALVNLCFGVWGLLQSIVLAYYMDVIEVPKNYQEVILIICSAFLAFFAQTCVTLALKYEQAGPVALVRTTEVIFAFAWQAVFLGVKPDMFSVIGAVVTLSGVALAALRKMIMTLPEDDKTRQRFRFILL